MKKMAHFSQKDKLHTARIETGLIDYCQKKNTHIDKGLNSIQQTEKEELRG